MRHRGMARRHHVGWPRSPNGTAPNGPAHPMALHNGLWSPSVTACGGLDHPVSLGWLWSPNVTALSGCAQAVSQQGCPWSSSRSTEQLWSPNVTARNGPAHPLALRKVALLTQRRSVRCPSSVTARPFPVRQWQHRAAAAARRHSTERLRPPNAASRSHGARRFGVPAWAVRSAAHRRPHAGFPRSVPVIPARRGTAGAVTPRGGSVPPPRPPPPLRARYRRTT